MSKFYSFSGDPYLNYTLTILAELPSIPFAYFVVNRWGRRPMLGFMQLLSGKGPFINYVTEVLRYLSDMKSQFAFLTVYSTQKSGNRTVVGLVNIFI